MSWVKCEGMESRNEALGTENSKPAFFWRREREGLLHLPAYGVGDKGAREPHSPKGLQEEGHQASI